VSKLLSEGTELPEAVIFVLSLLISEIKNIIAEIKTLICWKTRLRSVPESSKERAKRCEKRARCGSSHL
jgi:hypothetical protein